MVRLSLFVVALFFSSVAIAHHSIFVAYDYSKIRELEGTVRQVSWINPHVVITVSHANSAGEEEIWTLVGSSVNLLRRLGVTRETLKEGDRVVATGPDSRSQARSMVAAVIEVANGEQVVMFGGVAERAGLIDANGTQKGVAAEKNPGQPVAGTRQGLFRVWTPRGRPNTGDDDPAWPLTESARAALNEYDPLVDDPALSCIQAGMPVILDTPYPVEIGQVGGDIVIRTEEWDVVRTIHMNSSQEDQSNAAPSPWGYSLGRWDEDSLVISTMRINYPFFDDVGTPQSGELSVIERYRIEDAVLVWEATFDDPEIFTDELAFQGDMVWVPGETVEPFNCTIPDSVQR